MKNIPEKKGYTKFKKQRKKAIKSNKKSLKKERKSPSKRKSCKLPKNAKVGSVHTITVNNPKIGKRDVTFKRTKKQGFRKWKAIKNIPSKT